MFSAQLLDAALGLQQLNGNAALYHRLLANFSCQLDQDFKPLAYLLKRLATPEALIQDAEQAQTLTHSLKGLAGNLALLRLSDCCHDISKHLTYPSSLHPSHAQAFISVLQETQDTIASYLNQHPLPTEERHQIDPHELHQRLSNLNERIQRSEYIDDEELNLLSPLISSDQRQWWHQLQNALSEFDFDEAQAQLKPLLASLTTVTQTSEAFK